MLYPMMTRSRMVSDLSGVWRFQLDDGRGFAQGWPGRLLPDPQPMAVPASYNDLEEGAALRDHYGWAFYQREIAVPAYAREGRRVALRCDAVTHRARVFLNGQEICRHRGGFLPFEIEVGHLLRDGDNLLTIAVDNVIDDTTLPVGGQAPMMGGMKPLPQSKPQNYPNFDFFNYCGITRPVRLYTTPLTYIRDVTVVPVVPDPLAERVSASFRYAVDAAGPQAGEAPCRAELFDAQGALVGTGTGRAGEIVLEDAVLWQPMNPYLYQLRVTLGEGDAADEYTLPVGARTVAVSGQKFLINGRPFYFKGYGKHEDTFPNGRGLNLPMDQKDLSLMKWQGANSFRTSHYPYSEEMMRLCDQEGFVVIDETPAVGINYDFGGGANFNGQKVPTFDPEHGVRTFEHHQEVIREMIGRDKNHPCVVMWSVANEPDSYSQGAYEYFKPLFDLARELDPQNRPCALVSVAMEDAPHRDVTARLSDVICLNRYYGWYVASPDLDLAEDLLRQELAQWRSHGKPVLFTEYGADTVMGARDATPVMFTEEYQLEYYQRNNKVFDEFDFVVGEQAWNFADFATSQSLMRVQGNKKGLFTRDRKPKLAAHYFRRRWRAIPDFGYKP